MITMLWIDSSAMTIGLFAFCLGAYLVGSLNAAAIVARSRGLDIYATGSGNPGASNVYRSLGKRWAALVYVVDLLKGFVPALIALLAVDLVATTFAGLCAVVGHCFPVFHKFRGGKGVATGGGVILAVAPLVLVGLALIYAVLVRLTKISSAGSLVSVLSSVPLVAVSGVRGWALVWVALIVVLIIYRHRSNIARLLGGSEHKVVTP